MSKVETVRERTYHNPKGILSCGDKGGLNHRGEPCEYAAGWGTDHPEHGRCVFHDDGSHDADKQLVMDTFLHLVQDGAYTVHQAAELAGRGYATIFRWRRQDAQFDAAVRDALDRGDAVRTRAAEDTLYRRIIEERATATEVTLYLTSLSGRFRKSGVGSGVDDAPVLDMRSSREKLKSRLEGIRARLNPGANGDDKKRVTVGNGKKR